MSLSALNLNPSDVPQLAPPAPIAVATSSRTTSPTSERRYRRPLFAFWGSRYNRIDGFTFTTALRGSGTGIQLEAAWKTYRGVKPILPKKVFVQARVDGGRWGKVSGARGKIGGFVETKNAVIGDGAKVPHLSYVGDAEIGEGTNIGAGTIFANYDGVAKHRTVIGRFVKTGSNNTFVAPVAVGDGAGTAGGTVVRRSVPAGALAVSSSAQRNLEGWAESRRAGTAQAEAARTAREQQETTEG